MKIETQKRDDHQIQITAEVEQSVFEQHKHRAVRAISKQAKIPGFRPGRAPYAVIQRMYGEEMIQNEAIETLVNEIYPKIIDEAGIEPFGPGSLEEITSYDPPTFSFIIPLNPEVELCDYRAIEKEYKFEEASDEEIDSVIKRLQIQSAVTEPVEDRAVEEDDLVNITVSATILNPDEDQEAKIATDSAQQIYVNEAFEDSDTWPYVGFAKELIGMNLNDEKTVTHTFNEIEETDELFGKEVEFSFTVTAINTAELPEVNEEFAQTINTTYDSVEALRTAIQENIESYRKQQYEDEYVGELIDEIVEKSTIAYPPQLLEEEIKEELNRFKQQLSYQGMEFESYLKANEKEEAEVIEETIKPQAAKRVVQMLVMQEILTKEEITVKPDELQRGVAQAAMQSGIYNYLSQLPKKQSDELSQRFTLDTANRLLNDKLLKRLIAIASGQMEEETTDEVESETEIETVEAPEEAAETETEESEAPETE